MRGGAIIGAGIVLGNIIGFVRVAITAYLLGTYAHADALAVAIGPIDTLNSVLINTMVFAFVPMLMLRQGSERTALFRRAMRIFACLFATLALAIVVCAPLLIRTLGPGLQGDQIPVATNILRIIALTTLAAGVTALQSAILFTERRFGPTAFYQACLNIFTIAGALLLWPVLGIYGFALGYLVGSCVQCALVCWCSRSYWSLPVAPYFRTPWRELVSKPGSFLIYAGLIALNLIVTRAHATQAGPGMAAAFDYCIRCVNVVVAYLVSPVSNSLLPEIAKLRARNETGAAWRLVDRTTALIAGSAVAACLVGELLRRPIIAILFQCGLYGIGKRRIPRLRSQPDWLELAGVNGAQLVRDEPSVAAAVGCGDSRVVQRGRSICSPDKRPRIDCTRSFGRPAAGVLGAVYGHALQASC